MAVIVQAAYATVDTHADGTDYEIDEGFLHVHGPRGEGGVDIIATYAPHFWSSVVIRRDESTGGEA